MEKNKRFFARQIFDLPFSFEIGAIEGKVKNVRKHGTGVDISSCGLGMKTKYALREGSVLKFFLPMRKLKVTIPVFAQVMWSMPANDHFRVGLRFLA
jgi:hypothetical protein